MNISQAIMDLRIEKGVYQKDLAAYLNVSVGTISNYEKGIHSPDLDMICKIADYFGVTTDYLLGRSQSNYNTESLNYPLSRDYTVADVVNTTISLAPQNRHCLLDYLELLQLRSESSARKPRSETKH